MSRFAVVHQSLLFARGRGRELGKQLIEQTNTIFLTFCLPFNFPFADNIQFKWSDIFGGVPALHTVRLVFIVRSQQIQIRLENRFRLHADVHCILGVRQFG